MDEIRVAPMSARKLSSATVSALTRRLNGLVQRLPVGYIPLFARNQAIGALPPDFARRVREVGFPFLADGDSLQLDPALTGGALESAWMAQVTALRKEGWFRAWREEYFDVRLGAADESAAVLCRLERGAFRRFGLRSRAVHLNAVTPDGRMWIARRAAGKAIDPGLLDNLVGGGLASGETPRVALLRECAEEAGIAPELAGRARPMGTLFARREEDEGIHNEWLHVWQLELPADFAPRNTDGEVDGFMLLDRAELAGRILADEFTTDAAAVAATWLLGRFPQR
ncbi:NUDIX hydrolase [Zoogloeaceae bacteirum Par-f-2]|nr:NUDIX hydrolase [Zoogloeaceae bacteirum Par-f-2]